MSEQRDTKTIAGKFAEALGCLDTALYWLAQVNEQYYAEQDELRLFSLSPSYNAALDFWLQAEKAEDWLKTILAKLQRVEPLAPKGKVQLPQKDILIQRLIEAVNRHEPMANDPAVIDAINAVEDALKEV